MPILQVLLQAIPSAQNTPFPDSSLVNSLTSHKSLLESQFLSEAYPDHPIQYCNFQPSRPTPPIPLPYSDFLFSITLDISNTSHNLFNFIVYLPAGRETPQRLQPMSVLFTGITQAPGTVPGMWEAFNKNLLKECIIRKTYQLHTFKID